MNAASGNRLALPGLDGRPAAGQADHAAALGTHVETVDCVAGFDDRVRRICEAIDSGSAARFVAEFDALAIRQSPLSRTRQQQVLQWVTAHLRRPAAVGLEPHPLASLTAIGAYFCQARWLWPEPRYSDECSLAMCQAPVGAEAWTVQAAADAWQALPAVFTASIRRHEQVQRGTAPCLHWQPQWHAHHVLVAAVIDLGFARVLTEPLLLGVLHDWTRRPGRRNRLTRWLPRRQARGRTIEPRHDHGA